MKEFYATGIHNGLILIIEKDDVIFPKNKYIGRYSGVYIHKDNPYKEEFIERLQNSIWVLGIQLGFICEFEDKVRIT
jgi:hypothetical protein